MSIQVDDDTMLPRATWTPVATRLFQTRLNQRTEKSTLLGLWYSTGKAEITHLVRTSWNATNPCTKTKYLGLIISADGISMDPATVVTVKEWASPQSVKGVQTFLGFTNFYRRFIKSYSEVVSPLTALTRKGIKFQLTTEAEGALQTLKETFTSAPVLIHFDLEKLSGTGRR